MSANETYYEILGVEQDVDISVIKKAYRKLILKYHPDRNQDNRELAEEMTKKINEAYEVLSNEEKRREYDEKLADDSDGDMEYFCAFGLLLTLVWLYLEILRLLQMIMAMFGDDN